MNKGARFSRREVLAGSGLLLACRPVQASTIAGRYGRIDGDRFPIPAINLARIQPRLLKTEVAYQSMEQPGTIVVDPANHFLYLIQGSGTAQRYGVGVGREGFGWSGDAVVHSKQEWPDWYPPKEMLQRQPELMRAMSKLQSGVGMHGGPRNPLGARALYLWQDNKDTLYRIHGTVEPWSIGHSVSSGCIRMINQDVISLYRDTPVGTKVIVLPSGDEGVPDLGPDIARGVVSNRRRLLERGLY